MPEPTGALSSDAGAPRRQRRWRLPRLAGWRPGSLAARYSLVISLLVGGLLLAAGSLSIVLSYRENVERISQVQQAEAKAAATRIQDYLHDIETQVRSVASVASPTLGLSDVEQRTEIHRLMMRVPAIHDVRIVTPRGEERLFVSRVEPDRVRSGLEAGDLPALRALGDAAVYYGATYRRGISDPFLPMAVRTGPGRGADVVLVELNLKFVSDVVDQIRVGREGRAYIVGRDDRLLAHPDLGLVLAGTTLRDMPQVRAARGAGEGTVPAKMAKGPDGRDVVTTAVPIPEAGWLVFVEQPVAEAMAPVRSAGVRGIALFGVGLLLAFVGSRALANALSRPIVKLRQGASRIADGDLAARIDVRTGDEIEALAREFNAMAARLQQSYAGLEARVAARTRQLSEASETVRQQASALTQLNSELRENLAELDRKKDEAERANAAKTRFLASASHDLRQPMHTISLLVGVLRGRMMPGETAVLVDRVQLAVEVMESLFNGLLDISKLDAGIVERNVVAFPIASVLARIETGFAPQAAEKNLRFAIVRSQAMVESDPVLLGQIVSNLVANAIRYTPEGGRVVVGVRRRGDRLCLQVHDDGVGIPREHLDDVFEEFFQLNNPERDRHKGLGLGLSIVRRTADLLGHPLHVESTPGTGTAFTVELPYAGRAVRAAPVAPEPAGPAALPGAFVLVIDDEPENRDAMERLCRQWGCHVEAADSAAGAIERLAHHLRTPDLVISDYRLRDGLNGLAAVIAVRKAAEEAIPAIILTGDLSVPRRGSALPADVVVLHKPINAGDLHRIAGEIVRRAPARDDAG